VKAWSLFRLLDGFLWVAIPVLALSSRAQPSDLLFATRETNPIAFVILSAYGVSPP
jgi:hypothetical protein